MPELEPLHFLYGVLALVPAIIWLSFIFGRQKNKKFQIIIFLLGALSVAPIFLLQYLFQLYPQIDIIAWADKNFTTNPLLHFLVLYAWVSITEELIKQWMVRYLDSKYLLVQTINDSIHFSLVSALGFSFAENIFYLYHIGVGAGLGTLLVTYLFRSIFTTCGHLVFSGFFGYYYGRAKFSISLVNQSSIQGKPLYFSRFIGKLLNISKFQAYQEATIIKGLLIAIVLHTVYNYLLEMSNYTGNSIFIAAAAIFIIGFYLLLRQILKFKAGSLILLEDNQGKQRSTMAKTDEEVVIELLGMWFNSGRYVDVLHICDRLLKRDPENKIVQLFKARATDKMEQGDPYKKVLNALFTSTEDKSKN